MNLSLGLCLFVAGAIWDPFSETNWRSIPRRIAEFSDKTGTDLLGDRLPHGALARLGTDRLRNSGTVISLAFASDGKRLLSFNQNPRFDDDEFSWWETDTGKFVRRHRFPRQDARYLAISPDSKTAVVAFRQFQKCFLIDTATGQKLHEVLWNADRPGQCAAFSADGKTLAISSYTSVDLWEVETAKHLQRFKYWWATNICLSGDGKQIAVLTASAKLHVGDVATGKTLWSSYFAGKNSDKVYESSIAMSRDGAVVAAGNSTGAIRILDARSGKVLRHFKGHDSAIGELTFAADGRFLASYEFDATVVIWEFGSGQEVHRRKVESFRGAMAFSHDGETFGYGENREIMLLKTRDWKQKRSFDRHAGAVAALEYLPDGQSLLAADLQGQIVMWSPTEGRRIRTVVADAEWYIDWLTVAPDGQWFATAGTKSGKIQIWETATGRLLHSLVGDTECVFAIKASPDGRMLASSGGDGTVRLWSVAKGIEIDGISPIRPADCSRSLAFLSDGVTLAFGQPDGIVVLRNLLTAAETRLAVSDSHFFYNEVDDHGFQSIAISPDGEILSAAGVDRVICRWQIRTGRELSPLVGHERGVQSLAYSRDGRSLVSADFLGAIRIWEAASGDCLRKFGGHGEEVSCVAFAPDGRSVVSGGADCMIYVWDATRFPHPWPEWNATEKSESRALWELLADPVAANAQRAVWQMVREPNECVALLQTKVLPVPHASKDEIRGWIDDFNSRQFSVRNKAHIKLRQMEEIAAPALKQALAELPSLETKRRIEALLAAIDEPRHDVERLRLGRAMTVLEQANNRDARELLAALSRGEPNAWLTREAAAVLRRLEKQAKSRNG